MDYCYLDFAWGYDNPVPVVLDIEALTEGLWRHTRRRFLHDDAPEPLLPEGYSMKIFVGIVLIMGFTVLLAWLAVDKFRRIDRGDPVGGDPLLRQAFDKYVRPLEKQNEDTQLDKQKDE